MVKRQWLRQGTDREPARFGGISSGVKRQRVTCHKRGIGHCNDPGARVALGSLNARSCSKSTSETPVSSDSSRRAASSSDSSGRTKPPGNAHCPANGHSLRRIKSTWSALSRTVNRAMSAVTDGRSNAAGHNFLQEYSFGLSCSLDTIIAETCGGVKRRRLHTSRSHAPAGYWGKSPALRPAVRRCGAANRTHSGR